MDVFEELSISIDDAKKIKKGSKTFENFCYQVYQLLNGNRKNISEVSRLIDVPTEIIINTAILYKDTVSLKDQSTQKFNMKNETHKCDGEMVEALLQVKEVQELIEIFEKYQINNYMLSRITSYLINTYPRGHIRRIGKIKRLFDIHERYLEEVDKKKKSIEEDIEYQKIRKDALMLADEILARDDIYTLDGISKVLSIGKRQALQYLKVLKQEYLSDGTVYNKIAKKIEENRKSYYVFKYQNSIDKVLKIINKPIKIGENFRLFDLLDCITYFKEDLPEIIDAVPIIYNCSAEITEQVNAKEEIALLEKIINYYHFEILKTFEEKQSLVEDTQNPIYKTILESKIVKPYTDDFDQRMITYIEKEDIIRLMRKNKIPLTMLYFNLALKRYNNDDLEIITKDNINSYIKNS